MEVCEIFRKLLIGERVIKHGKSRMQCITSGLNCISIFDREQSLGDAAARCRDLPVTRGRTKPQRFIDEVLCCFIELLNICFKTGTACSFGMPSVCLGLFVLFGFLFLFHF